MLVSRTASYALQVLGFLAANTDSRVTGEEIARHTGIPANYLSKILTQLRKQGIVTSEKGWGGGFTLRPDARKRPIQDVLTIIDGADSVNTDSCLFGLPKCDADNPCPLHPYWEQIRGSFEDMLQETKVQNLAD